MSPRNVALVLAGTAFDDQHPPFYYLTALAWTGLAGTSERAVRSFSAVCSLATLPVVYRLGAALSGRRAGAFGALLLAALPVHVYYAREARMYALLGLLATASTLALVRLGGAARDGRRGGLVAYVLLASATALTHYFGVVTVLAHAVAVALRGGRTAGEGTRWPAVFLVPLAVFAPFGLVARWQSTHRDHGYFAFDSLALRDLILWLGGAHPTVHPLWALPLASLALYGGWRTVGTASTEPLPRPPVCTRTGRFALAVAAGTLALAGLFLVLAHAHIAAAVTSFRVSCGEHQVPATDEGAVAARALVLAAWAMSLALAVLAATSGTEPNPRAVHPPGVPTVDPLGSLPHLGYLLVAVPLALTMAAGMAGVPALHVHNFIAVAPMVALLAGAGLHALPSARGALACIALMAGFVFMDSRFGAVPCIPAPSAREFLDHTYADWRALRGCVPETDRAPVVTVQTFATDAVMSYLATHDVARLYNTPRGQVTVGQLQRSAHGEHPPWRVGEPFRPPRGQRFWWIDPRIAHPGVAQARLLPAAYVLSVARCAVASRLPPDAVVFRCEAR